MSLSDHPGLVVSSVAHAALLLATLLSFAQSQKFDDAQETIPVEVVTDQQFNQIMKGEKSAKEVRTAPKVDKLAEIAETKPHPPLAEAKKDIPTPPPPLKRLPDPGEDDTPEPPKPPEHVAVQPPPRPVPEPPKPEPKPEPVKQPPVPLPPVAQKPPPEDAEAIEPKPAPRPKTEPKPEAKPEVKPRPIETAKDEPKKVEAKPEPKIKLDQVAKLLEHEKQKEAQKPAAKPKSGDESAEPQRKFDPGDINKILSKEPAQRRPSTGGELQQLASLGSPTASAPKMSPSLWGQLDGLLQEQYKRCWSYIGVGGGKYIPEIRVQYAQDGSLIGQPSLINPPSDPNLRSLAESALRAVRRCNPLRIPAQYQPFYEEWKARRVRFDPEEMS
jgi:colicin import membrane protein